MTRELLPARRKNWTRHVHVHSPDGGVQGVYYCVGMYPDGRPGELFIDVAKAGAALRTWASEAAQLFSISIQHGTPLAAVLALFIGSRSDPHGTVTGHPRITRCLSIMDCIAKDLAIEFLGRDDLADAPALCVDCAVLVKGSDA